jgi:hypothetical protein
MNVLQRGGEFIRRNTEEIAAASMLGVVVFCGAAAVDGFVQHEHLQAQLKQTTDSHEIKTLEAESRKAAYEGDFGVLGAVVFAFPAVGEIVDVRKKRRLGLEEFRAQKRDYTLVP